MNRLSIEKRKQVVSALMEGVGVNATSRLTGVGKQAILRLLADLGTACARFHDDRVRGLKPAQIECDEVWSFVWCKEKSLRPELRGSYGMGDSWLWTAIDPTSKLLISFHVGKRTPDDARMFMLDLAGRINNVATLSTDGLNCYPEAVHEAFGELVDFGQVVKIYDQVQPAEARYTPPKCVGCKKAAVIGAPRAADLSTSIIERSNLTIRSQNKRFARLTLGHSKKLANHEHSIAIFWTFYNWCRPHSSLGGKTPAMVAGLTTEKMSLEQLIGLIP